MSSTGITAADRNLVACHICCKLAPREQHYCPRCGSAVHVRSTNSLQRTVALLVTASILYIPANLYPIMKTEVAGGSIASTIMGGVVILVQAGSIPVAAVIFIASVVVPMAKIAAMFYLVWSISQRPHEGRRQRTRLYLVAEFIGKWSMIDVFVVAILVALVQLKGLLAFYPGIAAYSFTGVVLVTMLAAGSFDPRLMWDQISGTDLKGNHDSSQT